MKINYLRLPLDAQNQDELYNYINTNPKVLGEDVELLVKEFKTIRGICDILAKQKDTLLLVELKITHAPIAEITFKLWTTQVAKYVEDMLVLLRIFKSNAKIIPWLVASCPYLKEPVLLELDVEASQRTVTRAMPQGLGKAMRDIEELKCKRKSVQDSLNTLEHEEADLRLKLSFLRKQVLNFDPDKERTKINSEFKAANKELEKTQNDVRVAREELHEVKKTSEKIMTTSDEKNVYLDDYSGRGRTSTLVGKIEGDRFVWNKTYAELNYVEPEIVGVKG